MLSEIRAVGSEQVQGREDTRDAAEICCRRESVGPW